MKTLKTNHIIFAIGYGSGRPSIPNIPGIVRGFSTTGSWILLMGLLGHICGRIASFIRPQDGCRPPRQKSRSHRLVDLRS
jgi:hypothetical protein